MVAPSVPCTLVTPLSPHSLSFRPLIIGENADLMIRLPEDARSHARWVACTRAHVAALFVCCRLWRL
jgi:NAD+ kinase